MVVLGCFDTKGDEFSFLVQSLKDRKQHLITINTGVMESTGNFAIDFDNEKVAEASGTSLASLRKAGDRGKAVELMGKGAAVILADLVSEKRIKGVIGMGGGGGTYIALAAMQEVPLGIPKLCLSTIAAKDLSRQIGDKDIHLMPSVVDIAGLNSITKLLIQQAVAAVCGMATVDREIHKAAEKKIAISAFGNTSKCVEKCVQLLRDKNYEVLVFHATGNGGRSMEALIREGHFDAVLDITTTELADEQYGGVCSAGPERLSAASELGVPQVVVPGCLDMVNFGHMESVPEPYKSRQLYSWAPDVTLMRTNQEENEILGRLMSVKLNRSRGVVKIILPLQGISQVDKKGEVFFDSNADLSLFEAIKKYAGEEIELIEVMYIKKLNPKEVIFATSLYNIPMGVRIRPMVVPTKSAPIMATGSNKRLQ